MSTELLIERNDGVARLTLNRPERRNALSPSLLREMIETLALLEQEQEIRVVCITAVGEKAFCSGADLMASLSGETSPEESSLLYAGLLKSMFSFSKPLVGRINGHVMGGGLGLALAMDIVVAREGVSFGTPEVKVGLFPMMIAPLILRNMPRKHAMEMILCGGKLTAEKALEYGLINAVVPSESLDEAVNQRLSRLSLAGPLAQQRGKKALQEIENLPFDEAVTQLSGHLSFLMQTEDAAEGISAFLQKRNPEWKGL